MRERVKNYLKDKKIRLDIIEGAINSYKSDDFVSLFKKCKILNKSIDNDVGKHILASYKRASNTQRASLYRWSSVPRHA